MLPPAALADCPYSSEQDTPAIAAGCMIRIADRLLLVRHLFGGKLGVPAGYASGQESARCTAYRETTEETGLEVTVHELLREYANGFQLYRCRPTGAIQPGDMIDVPTPGVSEISAVVLTDPATVPPSEWRFPEQRSDQLSLFESLGAE